MARDLARDWMWSEACEMLARAERMHRELFRPAASEKRLPAGRYGGVRRAGACGCLVISLQKVSAKSGAKSG